MKLNKIIFPAPKSSYDSNSLLGEIVYIPRNKLQKEGTSDNRVSGKTTTTFSSLISSCKVTLLIFVA